MKTCTKCRVEKPIEDFANDNRLKTKKKARCRDCDRIASMESYHRTKDNPERILKAKQYYLDNKEKIDARCKEYTAKNKDKNRKRRMLQSAKYRALQADLPFNLFVDDIEIPTHCPILGVELFFSESSGANPFSPSLDRMIPELGYVKGNVWVISKGANYMKHSASVESLLAFADWINKGMQTPEGSILDMKEKLLETQ